MAKKFEARWLGSKTKQVACKRLKKNFRIFSEDHDQLGIENSLYAAHSFKCNWQKPVLKKLTKAQRKRIIEPIRFK
jgi:hypothetical protein